MFTSFSRLFNSLVDSIGNHYLPPGSLLHSLSSQVIEKINDRIQFSNRINKNIDRFVNATTSHGFKYGTQLEAENYRKLAAANAQANCAEDHIPSDAIRSITVRQCAEYTKNVGGKAIDCEAEMELDLRKDFAAEAIRKCADPGTYNKYNNRINFYEHPSMYLGISAARDLEERFGLGLGLNVNGPGERRNSSFDLWIEGSRSFFSPAITFEAAED